MQQPPDIPLVVDLDGTLVLSDTLYESAVSAVRLHPMRLLCWPQWLAQGKAALKQNLAGDAAVDVTLLPYNTALLDWLRGQKAQGRILCLCTAADQSLAQAVAQHLGLFDEVMASDGQTNLAGADKAAALERKYGRGGFDYAGNSDADLPVWQVARQAIVVNAASGLENKARELCPVACVFPAGQKTLRVWMRALRLYQWMKNLLLFMPMFAAHQLTNGGMWLDVIVAFVAFGLCASSVYIGNDLLDLESDRRHVRKRYRPFAAGKVSILSGVCVAPLLVVCGFLLAWWVSAAFMQWLLAYFILTCAYSWGLKRIMLLDCLVLSMLYTFRIIAGTVAANLDYSFWMLCFSVFLFLSLAFVKRYAEIETMGQRDDIPEQKLHGRGYLVSDGPLIRAMGIAAAYSAVLVLALYLNTETVKEHYLAPGWIWGAVPVMLFWINWMWMQAHRGLMHDDPLLFAMRDQTSLLSALAFFFILTAGTFGWLV